MPLLSSLEFILNLFQQIPELTAWEEIHWACWISAHYTKPQHLHLVLVSCRVWFSNKQTKYPRYAHNWSELYTGKFMNFVRKPTFVMNADKFYLAWFYFKYDSFILDILEWKNLNTTISVVMPAQTHPVPCYSELKIRNVQANKGKPRILTRFCQTCYLSCLCYYKMTNTE